MEKLCLILLQYGYKTVAEETIVDELEIIISYLLFFILLFTNIAKCF